jgi:hypothetical protein
MTPAAGAAVAGRVAALRARVPKGDCSHAWQLEHAGLLSARVQLTIRTTAAMATASVIDVTTMS